MRKFKFTIVETQESKEFEFQYLDFDLIFQNEKFFKIPTDINEVLDGIKNIPKMFKSKYNKIFKDFKLSDFDNGLDFNHKSIIIFTTPFYLPKEYKYKFVKPFRTITQEFVDSLQIISNITEGYNLENSRNLCDNKEFKTFLLQNIGRKYIVEEVQSNNDLQKLGSLEGKGLLKNCIEQYCKQKFDNQFQKYSSLELEEFFITKFDELFDTNFEIVEKITIIDNSLKDLVCFTIGETVLYIGNKKVLSFIPDSIRRVNISDKDLNFQIYSFCAILLNCCKQRLNEIFDEDFKNQF